MKSLGFKYDSTRVYSTKPGVCMTDMHPNLMAMMPVITGVTFNVLDRVPVITAARDGEHSPRSLHYLGQAIDLRCWQLHKKGEYADALRKALPETFDVIVESTHIHIEYDPL